VSEIAGGGGGQQPQDVKLTEAEIKLVAKLFSDPTYFPVEFRTWLKNYIEGSGIQINASQIRGGAGGAVNLPPGILLPYAGGKIASNVLPCDGQAVSRTFYDGLWDAIGSTWGGGDGSTTFNVPDSRDRSLFGAGAVVGLGGNDGRALGSRGGPMHHHYFDAWSDNGGYHSHSGWTDNGGYHSHSYDQAYGVSLKMVNSADSPANTVGIQGGGTSGDGEHNHGVNISGEGEHSHHVNADTSGGYDQDQVSYLGVKYVITTGKGA